MAARSDLQLLGNAAEFVQTELGLEFSSDPMSNQFTAMIGFMEDGITGLTGMEDIDPTLVPLLAATNEDQPPGLIDQLVQNPALLNTPGFKQQINEAAAKLQVPYTALENMLGESVVRGQIYQENFDKALDQPQYEPGSELLKMAIFQAALPIVQDEQLAAQFAESADLHHLIGAQSQGKLGGDYAGDKHGIGGLTEKGYAIAGLDYESVRGDAAGEITALVQYIARKYGTPVEAINDYKRTGIWGD